MLFDGIDSLELGRQRLFLFLACFFPWLSFVHQQECPRWCLVHTVHHPLPHSLARYQPKAELSETVLSSTTDIWQWLCMPLAPSDTILQEVPNTIVEEVTYTEVQELRREDLDEEVPSATKVRRSCTLGNGNVAFLFFFFNKNCNLKIWVHTCWMIKTIS